MLRLIAYMTAVIGLWIMAIFLTVFIHEAGHAIFGGVFGYRCNGLEIFRLGIVKVEGHWRFVKGWHLPMGRCWLQPLYEKRRNPIMACAGGCILNLVSGISLISGTLLVPELSWFKLCLFMFGITDLYLGIINLIPKGGMSDGDTIRELLVSSKNRDYYDRILEIEAALMNGHSLTECEVFTEIQAVTDEAYPTLRIEYEAYLLMYNFDKAWGNERNNKSERDKVSDSVFEEHYADIAKLIEKDEKANYAIELYTEMMLYQWWRNKKYNVELFADLAKKQPVDYPRGYMCTVISELEKSEDINASIKDLSLKAERKRKTAIYPGLWKMMEKFIFTIGTEIFYRESFTEINGWDTGDTDNAGISGAVDFTPEDGNNLDYFTEAG